MRKSSFATTSSQSTARAPRIEGSLPAKTDRFPNQTQSIRGKNAFLQTASLREFLGNKLPRKEAPVGLLMTIKEKIKAQQR
jgi:hypothetical protein